MTVSVSAANQPFPDVDATNEVTLRWGDGALDTVELTKLGQGTISHQFQPPPGVFTVMAHYKGAHTLLGTVSAPWPDLWYAVLTCTEITRYP